MSKNLDLWQPATWQSRPAQQQPTYLDKGALETAIASLSRLPPIVVSWEVEALKEQIAAAQRGERFILQGGDCAETFDDCQSDPIARKLKILLQMSLVLLHGMKKPVVRIGRMAGQYAKPRSADTETRDGVTFPSYRGDNVNRPGFTQGDREPDPTLMLRGYERAALTLNFVRALIDGGFADLHHPENWDLDFMSHSPLHEAYSKIVNSISDALDFFEALSDSPIHEANRVEFYASHEALLLHSEQAQTRFIPRQKKYFRGISNPVAVKIGPAMTAEWLQGLVATLNPENEPGRLALIHRMGAKEIDKRLPPLIQAVKSTNSPVLWVCDPMHGNTETAQGGLKTRRFENIVSELESAYRIHREQGTYLGGVHFELTGDDVTECTGGARGLTDADLARAYKSTVDPRLNYEQALELAMRIAGLYAADKKA
jgi:3-deoxy-7-phosphoheptulonate synthase